MLSSELQYDHITRLFTSPMLHTLDLRHYEKFYPKPIINRWLGLPESHLSCFNLLSELYIDAMIRFVSLRIALRI